MLRALNRHVSCPAILSVVVRCVKIFRTNAFLIVRQVAVAGEPVDQDGGDGLVAGIHSRMIGNEGLQCLFDPGIIKVGHGNSREKQEQPVVARTVPMGLRQARLTILISASRMTAPRVA